MYKALFVMMPIVFLACGCRQNAESVNLTLEPEKILSEGQNIPAVKQDIAPVQPVSVQNIDKPLVAVAPVDELAPMANTSFEKPSIENIQQALLNAGFYRGKVDGVLGPKTKKAIEDFQAQNSLDVDGRVGPKTWQKLGVFLNRAPVQGVESSQISN